MKPSKAARAAADSRAALHHRARKRIVQNRVTENKGKKGKGNG